MVETNSRRRELGSTNNYPEKLILKQLTHEDKY